MKMIKSILIAAALMLAAPAFAQEVIVINSECTTSTERAGELRCFLSFSPVEPTVEDMLANVDLESYLVDGQIPPYHLFARAEIKT